MADLIIRDENLAEALRALAARENRSVEEVLLSLLSQYETIQDAVESQHSVGSFAALATAFERADFRSGLTDTAERSREILEKEWGDALVRRIRGQDED